MPVELARRIDGARGQVPFNRWVVQALEKALAGGEVDGPPAAVRPNRGRSVEPASSRAPVPPMKRARDLLRRDEAAMERQRRMNEAKGL